MENLSKSLVMDENFYHQWFEQATQTQREMFWKCVWDQAAKTHSDNQFIEDLYQYYLSNDCLTYKQYCCLFRTINLGRLTLKDRL